MTQTNPFNRTNQNNPPVDEFELMRRRLRQRGATTGQERQQELSRQFASLGNLPSGAAMKARQKAATASERATNEAIQDINIAEAQTLRQEREAQAGRDLQRELQTQQLSTQERIAGRGFETDLEKARMAGANAIELQNLRNEAALKERQLVESGLDSRLASQMAQNRELFDLEMNFRERGQSFAEEIGRDELTLNKSITALNAMDLLFANGFGREEIGGVLGALGIPQNDEIANYFETKRQQEQSSPTAPPTAEEGAGEPMIVKNGKAYIRNPDGTYREAMPSEIGTYPDIYQRARGHR